MVLRSDLPREKAVDALLVLADLDGKRGALNWLEEQAHLFRTLLNMELARRPVEAAPDAVAEPSELGEARATIERLEERISELTVIIETQQKVLAWYSDPRQYRALKKAKMPAPVLADGGELARETLCDVEDGNGGPDGE